MDEVKGMIREAIAELFEAANLPRCACIEPYYKTSSWRGPKLQMYRCMKCNKFLTQHRVVGEELVGDET